MPFFTGHEIAPPLVAVPRLTPTSEFAVEIAYDRTLAGWHPATLDGLLSQQFQSSQMSPDVARLFGLPATVGSAGRHTLDLYDDADRVIHEFETDVDVIAGNAVLRVCWADVANQFSINYVPTLLQITASQHSRCIFL